MEPRKMRSERPLIFCQELSRVISWNFVQALQQLSYMLLRRLTFYNLIYFFPVFIYIFKFSLVILYELSNLLNFFIISVCFHLVEDSLVLRSDLMNYISGINS